jgi:NAD(P)H-dependent FMN reductase
MLTIISSSLSAASNSRILATEALKSALLLGIEAKVVDLRDFPLAACDGEESFAHPNVEELTSILRGSRAVIFASPIYNYDVSSALKNLIEHVGSELTDKVVGFMGAAGGERAYMSPVQFLNSIMLDFRSIIVPRFVYASRDAFHDGALIGDGIRARIEDLVRQTDQLSAAIETYSTGIKA